MRHSLTTLEVNMESLAQRSIKLPLRTLQTRFVPTVLCVISYRSKTVIMKIFSLILKATYST